MDPGERSRGGPGEQAPRQAGNIRRTEGTISAQVFTTLMAPVFRTVTRTGELDPRARRGHAVTCMVALRTSPAGFPMAPSAEEWEALSPAERAAVVAALPGKVPCDEITKPEGKGLDWVLEVHVGGDRKKHAELLLESEELFARVQAMYDAAQRRADEEARRREEAEQEVARLRAELERLKR